MPKSMIEQAQQQALNTCKAFDDIHKVLDALATFGNRATKDYIGKRDFFEGLQKMRNAVLAEQNQAIRDCFLLAGVGGPEVLNYSQQKFKAWFGPKDHEIMSFMEEFGRTPSFYKSDKEEAFRKEIKEEIRKIDNTKTNKKKD